MSELVYKELSFDEYLSDKTRISASDCKNFWQSPKYYRFKKYEEKQTEEARHFFVGTAFHCLILEPKEYEQNYCFSRKFDMRTNKGKEEFNSFSEQNKGKKILFFDEAEMINGMATSALENKTFKQLIKNSYRELSAHAVDEKTGLLIKLRPDSLSKSRSTITDIKTCTDSSKRKFKYSSLDFGYHITAAFYKDFLKRENYVFAAIEKEPPYQTGLYILSSELELLGRTIYRTCLDCIKFCYKHDVWPDRTQFEILKTAYEENDIESYFDRLDTNNLIETIY